MKSLHAKLKLVATDQERQELAKKLLELDNERAELYKKIDSF